MLSERLAHRYGPSALAELATLLGRARDEPRVWRALTSFASRQLGGQAVVLRRGATGPTGRTHFAPCYGPAGTEPVRAFEAATPLEGMGLVSAPPAGMTGGAFQEVFRSVAGADATGLVHARVTDEHVLLLVYRAAPPLLGRAKWVLLEDATHAAARALVRLASTGSAHDQSIETGQLN
jgi:hypothetical protein